MKKLLPYIITPIVIASLVWLSVGFAQWDLSLSKLTIETRGAMVAAWGTVSAFLIIGMIALRDIEKKD